MTVNRFFAKFTSLVEITPEGDCVKENMKKLFKGEEQVVRKAIVVDDVNDFQVVDNKLVFFMRYGAIDIEWIFENHDECERVYEKFLEAFLENADVQEEDIFDATLSTV